MEGSWRAPEREGLIKAWKSERRERLAWRRCAILGAVLKRRTLLRCLSGWLVTTILFAQVAVAAYVCPSMQPTTSAHAAMPCADMAAMAATPDIDQPALCHQHCQPEPLQQAADQGVTVATAMVALLLFVLSPTTVTTAGGFTWLTRLRRRDRAPPPPHSILHCCHRI